MKVMMIVQGNQRSVFLLEDDNGKTIGKLDKPFFVTAEEASVMARKFADSHPAIFPKRKIHDKKGGSR